MTASYGLEQLLYAMQRLRNPETGCPWDLRQDFASILPHTLEEAYEVADAIERQDWPHLEEELGDLLFQVIFYGQMGAEQGRFNLSSIINRLVEKLIRRHPHVFPDGTLMSERDSSITPQESEVNIRWDEIKAAEKALKPRKIERLLDDVPATLPALTRAFKLQKKASSVGFDWPDIHGVLDKIREELDEVERLEFNTLISSFDSLVRTKYDSGKSFEDIVDEFNNGLLNDELNEWVIFREYGFKLLTENLTYNGESLNVYNTINFDSAFRESLKRVYGEYVALDEIPDLYLDPSNTPSVFGMHIILASKGDNFEQPTAYFDQSSSEVIYTDGSNNLNDLPTQEQLTLFKTIVINEQTNTVSDISLPDSVFDAIDYYYNSVFSSSVYANTFLIESSKDIVTNDSLFTINNTENMAKVLEFYNSLVESIID